jgi:signal transduction histidine kinase
MTRAAEDMARGDLRQQIPVQGSDEVAQLATSFNRMSQEVEQSQQSLRDFLADASHELRTPLTSIQGFSQALLDGTLHDSSGAAEAGRIINEESLRMRRLVEDLLYLSRVESPEVASASAPVDVAGLLREASRRLQLTAEQRGLRRRRPARSTVRKSPGERRQVHPQRGHHPRQPPRHRRNARRHGAQ